MAKVFRTLSHGIMAPEQCNPNNTIPSVKTLYYERRHRRWVSWIQLETKSIVVHDCDSLNPIQKHAKDYGMDLVYVS